MKINNLYITILNRIKNLDKTILKIMKYGFNFSFLLIFISFLILFTYTFIYEKPNLFYIGIELFKSSTMFIIIFIIFGIGFDAIKKESI